MIIKPYYKWPKLSELTTGDKIRVKEDGFNTINSNHLSKFNGKMVTIKAINRSHVIIYEFNDNLGWYPQRFEIDLDK